MARQRGIFPLHNFESVSLSSDVCRKVERRRLAKEHVERWHEAGLEALNSLSGYAVSAPGIKPSLVSRMCQDHLKASYYRVGKPPSDISHEGALRELLKKSGAYFTRADIADYACEHGPPFHRWRILALQRSAEDAFLAPWTMLAFYRCGMGPLLCS